MPHCTPASSSSQGQVPTGAYLGLLTLALRLNLWVVYITSGLCTNTTGARVMGLGFEVQAQFVIRIGESGCVGVGFGWDGGGEAVRNLLESWSLLG